MASIQFRGLNEVLKAYENRDAQGWSLWDGKSFMFRGIGINELTTTLESLDRNGSTAIYTCKVYEEIDNVKKIKQNTECDGSFNFRLYDREEDGRYLPGRGLSSVEDRLNERMNQFEDRILKVLENMTDPGEDPGEQQQDGLMGTITGLLQDPDKLGKLINLGKSIFGQPVQPAYVGNVNKLTEGLGNGGDPSLSPSSLQTSQAAPVTPEEYEARVNRLGVAINTLEKADNKIVDHLEKLASISVNKPDQFKMLIGMLELY